MKQNNMVTFLNYWDLNCPTRSGKKIKSIYVSIYIRLYKYPESNIRNWIKHSASDTLFAELIAIIAIPPYWFSWFHVALMCKSQQTFAYFYASENLSFFKHWHWINRFHLILYIKAVRALKLLSNRCFKVALKLLTCFRFWNISNFINVLVYMKS